MRAPRGERSKQQSEPRGTELLGDDGRGHALNATAADEGRDTVGAVQIPCVVRAREVGEEAVVVEEWDAERKRAGGRAGGRRGHHRSRWRRRRRCRDWKHLRCGREDTRSSRLGTAIVFAGPQRASTLDGP